MSMLLHAHLMRFAAEAKAKKAAESAALSSEDKEIAFIEESAASVEEKDPEVPVITVPKPSKKSNKKSE